MQIAEIFAYFRKSGSRNTMVSSDISPEVEIRPVRACAMHPAIIIGTFRSLWTRLWGRYHVPQNAFLVIVISALCRFSFTGVCLFVCLSVGDFIDKLLIGSSLKFYLRYTFDIFGQEKIPLNFERYHHLDPDLGI